MVANCEGRVSRIVTQVQTCKIGSKLIFEIYTEGKSLAIYFGDAQFRNRILANVYEPVDISHNVKSDF